MAMVPPGWYPDPWRVGESRWWDGAQWTTHVGGVPQAQQSADRAQLLSAWSTEQRMSRWARAALCGWGLTLMFEVTIVVVSGRQIHRQFQQIFRQFRDGYTTPYSGPVTVKFPGGPLVESLLDALLLAAGLIFFIWQYNAATTARRLGYPARRSPGMGIGGWFIPIVNFWFPYQSLADCLPPQHSLRFRGIWAWLFYLAAGFLPASAWIVAVFSSSISIVVAGAALVFGLVTVWLGWTMMAAIDADHRRAMQALG